MDESLYRENILEHYKHPQNHGSMPDADKSLYAKNPSCGDSLVIFIKTENGFIKDIKWQGNGCAISSAAMSMLSEEIKGKTIETAKALSEADVRDMLGIHISPARQKCAFLALSSIQSL